MHASLQCLLSEAVWVWRSTPALTSQQEHAAKFKGLQNWLQHGEMVPLITWPVKPFTLDFFTSTNWQLISLIHGSGNSDCRVETPAGSAEGVVP